MMNDICQPFDILTPCGYENEKVLPTVWGRFGQQLQNTVTVQNFWPIKSDTSAIRQLLQFMIRIGPCIKFRSRRSTFDAQNQIFDAYTQPCPTNRDILRNGEFDIHCQKGCSASNIWFGWIKIWHSASNNWLTPTKFVVHSPGSGLSAAWLSAI